MILPTDLMVFLLVYGVINLLVFCIYARDKYQARHNAWRTSETLLLALALAGPFGAFAAMNLFRHKTRKAWFWLVPLFVCLHLGVAGYLLLVR